MEKFPSLPHFKLLLQVPRTYSLCEYRHWLSFTLLMSQIKQVTVFPWAASADVRALSFAFLVASEAFALAS